ncbi:MAG TPA: type III-A CRISPR-associated RAMP protein Csm5 [Syntrophobacteraceae bacterium]|nr:type III-A CRISPR-associated RAMP protein Csm5 [Syntrophobacteraceae bacterium]
MKAYRFRAQALTPVHVGSGNEINPLEFVLHENRLLRFSPAALIGSLPPNELARYLHLLERADLRAIHSFFNDVDVGLAGLTTVDISPHFMREYEEKASNPNNQFRVEMMPCNPHSSKRYLPGSGIKGAIRTALINHFADTDPHTRETVRDAVTRERDKRNRARVLEEKAFDRKHSQTERDVLRLVHVEDACLPDGATRIDRAVNWNPNRKGAENIQMWVERLKSVADGGTAPQFSVILHMDNTKMQHPPVKRSLGRTIDFDTILKACNHFYWGRMVAEGEKFDGKNSGGKVWSALLDLFPKGKTPDGQIVSIDPAKPYWCYEQRKRILLRVGRYSHFESLSVDGLREGYNAQARRPIRDMGSTRTRCLMDNGKPPMPFGWIMMTLESSD